MNYEEKEVDINQIFNEVTKTAPQAPNTYPLQFELNSLKELFEFLLQFVTMLCKEFYANNKGIVNLALLTTEQFKGCINDNEKCTGDYDSPCSDTFEPTNRFKECCYDTIFNDSNCNKSEMISQSIIN